jgi:hypothetical protein
MKRLCYSVLMLMLLAGASMGQELWDLGSSQDYLSVGPIYSTTPYYYYPYTYDQLSGFGKFFVYDYSSPYYFPSYWYATNPTPVYPEFWAQPYPNVWWVGSHRDLSRTLEIARTGSSFKVYQGGVWHPP